MPVDLGRGPVDIGARSGLARRPGHRGHLRKPRFEHRDARLERFIVLARDSRHLLDGLELLALDHIEIAQKALRLVAEQRLEFTADALRNAGRIVHQPGNLSEKPIRRLHHARLRGLSLHPAPAPLRNNGDGAAKPQGALAKTLDNARGEPGRTLTVWPQ